jgi:hypothetical protein
VQPKAFSLVDYEEQTVPCTFPESVTLLTNHGNTRLEKCCYLDYLHFEIGHLQIIKCL